MAIDNLMLKIKQAHNSYTENKTPENFKNTIDVYCASVNDFILLEMGSMKKLYTMIETQNSLYNEKEVSVKDLKQIMGIYTEYIGGMTMFINELKNKALTVASEELNRSDLVQKLKVAVDKDIPFIDSLFNDRVPTESVPVSVAIENINVLTVYKKYVAELSTKVTELSGDTTKNETLSTSLSMMTSSIEYFAYMLLITIIGNFTEIQDKMFDIQKKEATPFRIF